VENPNGIDVQATPMPQGLVVRIAGNASVDQVDELDRELHVVSVLAPKLVVLDLSGLLYVSSMGIGSLLRFRNQIADGGGRLAVAGLTRQVSDTFRMAGLGKVLPIYQTVDEALDGSVH
jgi:anti-anti-sigma factor